MPEWFAQNWIVMMPLSVCSVAGLAIILDRVWALRRKWIISAALAEAIEGLLIEPGRARALGEQGRRAVRERFSAERMAGKMMDVVSEMR